MSNTTRVATGGSLQPSRFVSAPMFFTAHDAECFSERVRMRQALREGRFPPWLLGPYRGTSVLRDNARSGSPPFEVDARPFLPAGALPTLREEEAFLPDPCHDQRIRSALTHAPDGSIPLTARAWAVRGVKSDPAEAH